MFLNTRIAALLTVTFFVATCAAQPPKDELPSVVRVDNAYDVNQRYVVDESAVQLTYKVRLDFPAQAIDEARAELLREQGWRECSTTPQWEGFFDAAAKRPRFSHQSQRVFVKEQQLLVTGMQYHSQGNRRDKPDNNEQHVVIMKYDLSREAVGDQMRTVFPKCVGAE